LIKEADTPDWKILAKWGVLFPARRNSDLAGCHYEQAGEEQRNFNFSLINRTLSSSGLEYR
jgi:hypothetical protein